MIIPSVSPRVLTCNSGVRSHDLHERDRDVEVLSEVREPDDSDGRGEESSQVPLVRRQVPDAVGLAVDLFVWQEGQLLVVDDRPTELQVAIEATGFVGTVMIVQVTQTTSFPIFQWTHC